MAIDNKRLSMPSSISRVFIVNRGARVCMKEFYSAASITFFAKPYPNALAL